MYLIWVGLVWFGLVQQGTINSSQLRTQDLVSQKYPGLFRHIQSIQVSISMIVTPWLLTAFADFLPPEVCAKYHDIPENKKTDGKY
jgi:hypothetical protein